jgi:hypothetical protein
MGMRGGNGPWVLLMRNHAASRQTRGGNDSTEAAKQTPAQDTRGGGAAGAARSQEKRSSPGRIASARGVTAATATTTGGGGAPPIESHCDTMPPQASIDFKTIVRDDIGSMSADSAAKATGSASSQQAGASQEAGSLAAEQQLACIFTEQHDEATVVFSAGAAARRCRAAITAGSTLRAFAQASVSAGVLQQQLEKHCSAVTQPQGLSIQGNGVERSFTASRFSTAGLAPPGAAAPQGNGKPEASSA